jgi:hypothetical protein
MKTHKLLCHNTEADKINHDMTAQLINHHYQVNTNSVTSVKHDMIAQLQVTNIIKPSLYCVIICFSLNIYTTKIYVFKFMI